MKHQSILCGANQHQVFSTAQNKFRQRNFASLSHRVRQQTIGLFTAFIGTEIIAFFEVDGIHLRKRHELRNLDGFGRFAFEGEASKAIEISEFVPLSKVDPVYFEKSYYLGPDKGGEKAYRLLSDAMTQAGKVALAKFVLRGRENLVLVRSAQNGLMLHTMYFADEVRNFDEISKGESAKISGAETNLALRLIDELSSEQFSP